MSAATRREPGSKVAVGDPDARVHHTHLTHRLEYPLRERVVTTEVARGTTRVENEQRPGRSSTSCGTSCSTARTHRLERARVRRIVGVDDGELRAPRLGFTSPQTSRHSFATRFGRRRLHDGTTIS